MLIFTKETLDKEHKAKLSLLIKEAGNYSFLAKMLGISPSTAQGWVTRGRISKEGAKLVEDHPILGEKFKAIELRPDLK
jgi:hypothetical protein